MAKKALADTLLASLDVKLAPLGRFAARRLFGGHGLYLDDVIFALLFRDALYLRVDERNRADFENAGMAPFSYRKADGRTISTTYWSCPAEVLQDPAKLRRWVMLARQASRERKPVARSRSRAPGGRVR